MKRVFKPGDSKVIRYLVTDKDVASFHGVVVHPVCSTFTLAREIEWATRQFVLEMKESHEEGAGTHVSIDHRAPAFPGEEIVIQAWVETLNGNELICRFEARVGSRLVAEGKTGQKILPLEKINLLLRKPV
jgi:predicted thioesterase